MIPTKTDIEIEGSLPGELVEMTLDANSLDHLMGVLSNLYSDKVLAVVREYSTNARDSHIEAGVDRPIEVSTPSDFKPYFTVRDYGVGMDADTIRKVYSRYGASTKRGTNSQNGMLGLGSKSALTYTTQFNVTGVKNGIKTHVVVSRSANGSGEMKIIGQQETDEPNGVTIQIPVANRRDIENTAYNFFRFWKPGTVLLNGKDPSKVEGMEVGKFIVVDNLNGVDYVVMGNVAYPVPASHRIFRYGYSRTSVVAYVEMGEVNFTPSREALHMTELTKATLEELHEEFKADITKELMSRISSSSDYPEAIANWVKIKETNLSSFVSGAKYKGEDIPDHTGFDWVYHLNSGTVYDAGYVDIKKLFVNTVVIVHDYEYEKVHTTHRQKLRLWLAENDIDPMFAYFTKEVPIAKWLAGITQVHWNDVKVHKIVRPKSADVKDEVFDVIDNQGRRLRSRQIDAQKPIVYDSPTTFAAEDARKLAGKFVKAVDENSQLVLVNKNKWGLFKKHFPHAVHFDKFVKDSIDTYISKLTTEEKVFLESNWKDRYFCARLDPNKVLDPKIKTAVIALTTAGLSDKTTAKYEIMHQAANRWDYKNFPRFGIGAVRLFDEYHLLDVYSHHGADYFPIEHVYSYMNNCYKENLVSH